MEGMSAIQTCQLVANNDILQTDGTSVRTDLGRLCVKRLAIIQKTINTVTAMPNDFNNFNLKP
eukprot:2308177-Amphidinium_carterae.1